MKRTFTSLCMLMCVYIAAHTQVAEKLRELGLENIRLRENESVITVAFEDNVHRGTYRGIGKAIETGINEIQRGSLEMMVLDNQIPQLCITLPEEIITAYKNGEINLRDVYAQMQITTSTDEIVQKLKDTEVINTSRWKTDIVLYPEVKLENFRLDRIYNYQVNLSPAIQTSPWQGALFTAQVIFPIATNMRGEPKRIRPGVIALSQDVRFKKNFLGRITMGNFTDNRIGAQAELKYRSNNGRIEVGGVVGSTGYSEINSEDGWYIGKKQRINGMLKGTLYEPRFNLEMSLQAGRYIYGDYGVRGDCTRHFGEFAIGVYGMFVEGELNGGFNFTIPLRGKTWKRNRMVRIKPADYFAAEYSREPYGKYINEKMGRTYDTRPDENQSSRFYQPDYIRYFLIKEAKE
ncbi:MAG: YjbH domain-containing protein [Bacteroides sp.]|nr:YjbH domain-containing protein [Bacteroides sp.]